jgi:hypothetical protein
VKVGDLVKLKSCASTGWADERRPTQEYERLGIITEWAVHEDGPLTSGWVRWNGNIDWDIEYLEDLELLSESR